MSELEWINIFGDNLRDILVEQRMSRQELADASYVSESMISKYINKQAIPNTKSIINMARALNLSLDEFIDFDDYIF